MRLRKLSKTEKSKEKNSVFGFYKYLLFLMIVLSLNAGAKEMSIYDFNVNNIDGKSISMSEYKGQVLLIVNVASKCGFTPQYEGLEKLHDTYKDEGFMVLGFPSNQFMSQEPGTNQEIKFFCQKTYEVEFDMFAKIDVNGENTAPLYKFLKKEQGGFMWMDAIKWNFTKFLVDKEGNVIKRYGSATKPAEISEDIQKLLNK
jgi:glutathione peroxidase